MLKKKSSKNGHSLFNDTFSATPTGFTSYVPDFVIPKPYRAFCHPCNMSFPTIEELQKHTKDNKNNTHERNKERYLGVKK